MAIRVYELSKKLGLSNKELLDILHSLGIKASSHVSVLPSDIIDLIEEEVKIRLLDNKKNKLSKKENLKEEDLKDFKEKDKTQELVLKSLSVSDIAEKIDRPVNEIILALLKQGVVANKNQVLSEKVIKKIAEIYNLKLAKEDTDQKNILKSISDNLDLNLNEKEKLTERKPIIVVIGHVDHGKTTLLDFIKKSKVAAKEKGGITQHLGAYQVNIAQGNMVFLDTPGHEAFSMLRVRGLKAADIAILVVAADDGVMPQTIEAINHAKSIGLPIIVAINKIDKASAKQIELVEQQLAKYDLIKEEWSGSTPFVNISAKNGTGVEHLLEVIALQSKLMELKTNLNVPAKGYILESKLEKGQGPVATLITQNGILKLGDYFFVGNTRGKVSSITDSFGNRIKQAEPSTPVLVSGFKDLSNAGDIFTVVTAQEYKKKSEDKINKLESDLKAKNIFNESGINLIIKADNASSKEALLRSIEKLSSKLDQNFNVIYSGLADITESDAILALDTKSMIYAFNVKALPGALNFINKNKLKVKYFDIIYNLLEDLQEVAQALKPIEYISKKVGQASVIKVFDIKSIGKIAGAHVKSGKLVKDSKVIILRGNYKIAEGKIKSLEREKKSVKEVNTGFEFALFVDNFKDWQIDDVIECYQDFPA